MLSSFIISNHDYYYHYSHDHHAYFRLLFTFFNLGWWLMLAKCGAVNQPNLKNQWWFLIWTPIIYSCSFVIMNVLIWCIQQNLTLSKSINSIGQSFDRRLLMIMDILNSAMLHISNLTTNLVFNFFVKIFNNLSPDLVKNWQDWTLTVKNFCLT